MIETLRIALSERRLQVDEVGGTLNVRRGQGPLSRSTNIDPAKFISWLNDRSSVQHTRDIAGWVNGVETTLLEPKNSRASTWTFEDTAGVLFPTLESGGFRHGVQDATGGDGAWVRPLDGEDLVCAWIIRLGRGIRPLTEDQVERWGVTPDRVIAAGRSMLFHSTRRLSWQANDDGVLSLSAGDGHDAARVLVAEDVFFTDVDPQWRFAIPTPDTLFAVRNESQLDTLVAATGKAYAAAEYPLDNRPWRLASSGPVPLEH